MTDNTCANAHLCLITFRYYQLPLTLPFAYTDAAFVYERAFLFNFIVGLFVR